MRDKWLFEAFLRQYPTIAIALTMPKQVGTTLW